MTHMNRKKDRQLNHQKPDHLPPSYVGSSLIGKLNGECAVTFHFSNTEEVEKWLKSVTEPKEAAPQLTRWQHRKSGGVYALLGNARVQTDIPLEDMSKVVVYIGPDGTLWARAESEFYERFDALPNEAPKTP